jgi:hypothetical protein
VTGAVLTAGVSAFAAPAKAEPDPSNEVLEYTVKAEGAVCRTLTKYPTIYGVRGILDSIEDQGFTPYDAGEIVALSVTDACPQFVPVLEKFVAVYGGGGSTV